jgi:transposase
VGFAQIYEEDMSTNRMKQSYSPEFQAEAVRQVIEGSPPIAAVARDLGVVEQTLGNWAIEYLHSVLDYLQPVIFGDADVNSTISRT